MTADPHAAARARMSRIQQQLQTTQRDISLGDVMQTIKQVSDTLKTSITTAAQISGRGYRYGELVKAQGQALQSAWISATLGVSEQVQKGGTSLQPEFARIQGLVGQAVGLVTNEGQFNTVAGQAEVGIRGLQQQAKLLEDNITLGFKPVNDAIGAFEQHLKDIVWVLDELKEASISLESDEAVIIGCQAEWAATGKGGEDPDGNLYLTNKRLVFEQKEKKGKLLGLFGGKQVQGQLWAVQLGQITGMTSDEKGLFGGRKMLLIGLADGAPYPELPLEVKDGFGNERLSDLITRAQSGQFGAPIDIHVDGGAAVASQITSPLVATPSAPSPAATPGISGGVAAVIPVGGGQASASSESTKYVASEQPVPDGSVPTTGEELLAGMTWETFTPKEDYFTVIVERQVNDGRDNFTPETDPIYLSAFSISARPVTNGEFNVFLNAPDGAKQRKWWEHSFNAIRDYALPNPTIKNLHQAVGNLNYWAALAYSLWLSSKAGEFFRLPLEAEWQHGIFDGITFTQNLREWTFEWGRGSDSPVFSHLLPSYVDPVEQNYQGKNSRTAQFYPQFIKPSVNWLVKQGDSFFPRQQALIPLGVEPSLGFRLVRTGRPYTDVFAEAHTNLSDVPRLFASIGTMWEGYLKLARAASPEAVALLLEHMDSGKVQPSNPMLVLGWISDRTDIPVERLIKELPTGNDALNALNLVPMDKKLPLLRQTLASESDTLRANSLSALRDVDLMVKLEIFIEKLNNDPSAQVRERAARLLGRLQVPQALQTLVDKRTDPDMKVAKAIQQSIDELKKAMPDVVIESTSQVSRTAPDQWGKRVVKPRLAQSSSADVPEIIWLDVPAGTHEHQQFIRGEMREGIAPQHIKRLVELPAFKISQTVVTRAQWYAFLVAPDGYRDNRWWEFSTSAMESKRFAVSTQPPTEPNTPQTNIPYDTMLAFCMWMSHKIGQNVTIPSLAELDYAEITLGSVLQSPTDDAPEITITARYKDEDQLTMSMMTRFLRGVRRDATQPVPPTLEQKPHGFRLIITNRQLKPIKSVKSVNEDLQAIIQAKQTHNHTGIHNLAPHVAVMRDATMIPVLMDMMFSDVNHVRHSAYFIAKWVATDLPLPIEPMIEALIAEPIVDKRNHLSTALGLSGADAVPHLEKLMQHEDALLRAEAIAALGVNLYTQQPTDSRVVAALTNALQDSHEGTVVKAIEWLALWTDPQIKATIAALANDKREVVKKAAQKVTG